MASVVFLFIKKLDFTIMQNEPNRNIDTFQLICGSVGQAPRAFRSTKVEVSIRYATKQAKNFTAVMNRR
jgi:hypothetical protein